MILENSDNKCLQMFFAMYANYSKQNILNLLYLPLQLRNTGKGVLHFLQAWFEFSELGQLFEAATLESSQPQKKEEFSRKTQELLSVWGAYS